MNKILRIFLISAMFILIIVNFSYAANNITLYVEDSKVSSDVEPMIIDGRVMVPLRAVFQNYGAYILWDSVNNKAVLSYNTTTLVLTSNSKSAMVNNDSIELDVPAQIINGRFLIPTRFVAQNLGFDIAWDDATRSVKINKKQSDTIPVTSSKNIYNINVNSLLDKTVVNIKSDGQILNYQKTEMKDQNKVFVDIQNAVINLNNVPTSSGDAVVSKVRYSQYSKGPDVVRVVVDLNQWSNYELKLSEDQRELNFIFDKKVTVIKDINYRNDNNTGSLNVVLDGNKDYKVMRLTNPQRILIQVNKSQLERDFSNMSISDALVQGINISNNNGNTEIVLNVSAQPQYQVIEEPNGITINLYKEQYQNVSYSNYGDYGQITINTSLMADNINSYYDDNNSEFVVLIPESVVQLGTGTMEINDDILQRINISQSKDGLIRVDLVDNKNMKQDVYKYSDKIVINIKNNYANNKVVVIDAGHGGKDPGARYETEVNEKDLNLYIAQRLNEILKQKGIKTIMTRDSDVSVDLYQRPQIANNANAALFISVHNNWMKDSTCQGTMTLYTDKGDPKNLEFAKIIHQELLSALGSTDRKVINRRDLVVLRETQMPAVLAEVGFISNSAERQRLEDNNYLDRAAQALADGVEKELKNIK